MFDLDLLVICNSKENYERYSPFIKEHTLSTESWKVFSDMEEWYKTHTDIDWSSFRTWFKMIKHPKLPNGMLYDILFKKLETHVVDGDLEKELTATLIGRDYATRISVCALSVAEGSEKESMDDVVDLVEDYQKEVDRSVDLSAIEVTSDIHELVAATTGGGGIDWRISQLNDALGGLRKGDFIVVGARPDSGKTSFLASESTYFMPQLSEDQCVLWFNNEEGGAKVKKRVITAGIGWSGAKVDADPLGAKEKFEKECGPLDKLSLMDDAGLSTKRIEQIIKQKNPGVIIFDQLWKIPGFAKEAGNEVMRQTMLFNWGREMAKAYAPVITVHQAGGEAGGDKWLTMESLYGSKTGIQGEADAIITIGRTYNRGEENDRFFFIPKNKMYGKDSKNRNGRFIAVIDTEIARFDTDGEFEIS